MFVVYIIYSVSLKKYYTGQTNNIEDRLERHNKGQSIYTKNGIPWELKYKMELSTRAEAVKLETKIKKQGAERYLIRISSLK